MTDKHLKDLCALWQKRLTLQDWQIDVRFVDSGDVREGVFGLCYVHADNRRAIIKIVNPDSHDPGTDFYKAFPEMFDIERTLVHELLHIPLDGIVQFPDDVDEFKQRAQEQAMELLTDALLAAYKGG